MQDYVITCCSTADLSKEHFEKIGVPYAMFSYFIDGTEYKDDLYASISPQKFFNMIADGAEPTTAQISPGSYVELWEPYLKEGKSIIHLALSSGISGTYQSACIARDTIISDYPDCEITVIDSLAASSGFGLLVAEAKSNYDKGMSYEDNVKWIEDNKKRLHHWFFSTDLSSYIRGGRVSKVSGFFGTVLNICPLLNVNDEGKLIPREKIRGKKKVIDVIFKKMQEHATGGQDYSGKVYMSHSDCIEDAKAVADKIKDYFKSLDGDVEINDIGTVIGSHTGPGTVALFFWGDERTA